MKKIKYLSFFNGNKCLMVFVSVFVTVLMISIFQDFLASKRNNYPFFFSESLLFKGFWLVFPPILLLLKRLIKNRTIKTHKAMGAALFVAVLMHVLLTSLTVWSLSVIFRDQSYAVVKVLTYTLAHDLVKVILVYGVFIYALKYLINNQHKMNAEAESLSVKESNTWTSQNKAIEGQKFEVLNSVNYLVVNSGKNTIRINLSDILFIQSATPYVSIQLADKQYLQSTTLKSIAEKLDLRFIRIHRSSIINLEKVLSYQSRLNGDYDLTLDNGSHIRLSRNYVKAFRSRFGSTPQLKT